MLRLENGTIWSQNSDLINRVRPPANLPTYIPTPQYSYWSSSVLGFQPSCRSHRARAGESDQRRTWTNNSRILWLQHQRHNIETFRTPRRSERRQSLSDRLFNRSSAKLLRHSFHKWPLREACIWDQGAVIFARDLKFKGFSRIQEMLRLIWTKTLESERTTMLYRTVISKRLCL